MSRSARPIMHNASHHVISRGIRRKPIFLENNDFEKSTLVASGNIKPRYCQILWISEACPTVFIDHAASFSSPSTNVFPSITRGINL